MNTMSLIITILLLVLSLILYAAYQLESAKRSSAEAAIKEYEEAIDTLEEEILFLREENKIKSKNRREADEKIDSLHTGDIVNNVISGLCKHKDNNGTDNGNSGT